MRHRKVFCKGNHNYQQCLVILRGKIHLMFSRKIRVCYCCYFGLNGIELEIGNLSDNLNFLFVLFESILPILTFLSCVCVFRYEAKRIEIETWLARMENRLEQMGKIATTADVLEAQQKEQKVSFLKKIKNFNDKKMFPSRFLLVWCMSRPAVLSKILYLYFYFWLDIRFMFK